MTPSSASSALPTATRLQLILGFATIYLVWGSTYLAIRWSVLSIPPFMMGAVRFLIAGAALYAWSRARGAPVPTRLEWRNAAIVGGLLLLVGNGAVSWASQRVDSGVVSLLVATVPLWLVLCEFAQGTRPRVAQLAGVAIGLVGVALLVLPAGGETRRSAVEPLGAIVLALGSLSWTMGSLFSRRARFAHPASLASGMQMLTGGAMLLALSVVSGEPWRLEITQVTLPSVLSLLYLIIFGSFIGFSTYMWLLKVASPTAVGTYAYVNPLVAVLLGVLVGGERLPPQAFLAMFVIIGGVAMVSVAPQLQSATRAWAIQRKQQQPLP
jgi:drug/metabolite transporter (DMT)-like permease